MRALVSVSRQFFAEIWRDVMLAAMLFVPILMGCLFRFSVPALETVLCARLARQTVLAPYYPMFDLVLALMTPIMAAFSGVMVILGENDTGLARALAVTPAGRNGYLLSRIGIPALLSVVWCFLIVSVLTVSGLNGAWIAALSLLSALVGTATALMVVSLAKNKVEGLALTKLCGFLLLGLPAALLLPVPVQYAAAVLPSYWMTRALRDSSPAQLIPALVTALLWCALFWRRFMRKLLG